MYTKQRGYISINIFSSQYTIGGGCSGSSMDFVFVSHIKSAGGPSHKISTEQSLCWLAGN